jgi:hypothetical protein
MHWKRNNSARAAKSKELHKPDSRLQPPFLNSSSRKHIPPHKAAFRSCAKWENQTNPSFPKGLQSKYFSTLLLQLPGIARAVTHDDYDSIAVRIFHSLSLTSPNWYEFPFERFWTFSFHRHLIVRISYPALRNNVIAPLCKRKGVRWTSVSVRT